ncbi:AraC family ligand binding domain-containing protein [Nocardiopsis sp. MG754419]|uniref:AraC family ligand binding domain-containing protein n=1 Tax=Nocardiopsis sp. MG754419 TaxID=2259865 RepID=UPI001BA723BB|nr:AraC family ligand binding domain-containing protein [Nocardiopsis sp. MG754419]MBR8743969.1 cupin [Nocardiopsis sp. MG754419]
MTRTEGTVRRFRPERIEGWQRFGDHAIRLGPVVEAHEGGPLSAYFARFAQGERAPLPAPYSEVWVVLRGAVSIHGQGATFTAGPGELLHVPEHSPGEVWAEQDTEMACVSVPAH